MEGSRPLQYSLFDDLPPSAPGRATTVSVSDAAAGRRSAAATSLPLRIAVLGSGSGGNCVVVDSGGRRLLLDAGFSCREIERRLRTLGIEPASLDGVVLTHEHGDHARGAERLVRRHGLPVHATSGTLAAGVLGRQTGKAGVVVSGRPFEVGGFLVEAFTVPHDAREPVGLVVEDGAGRRVGLVADLGARSQLAWARLREVSVLLLETNHDLEMLRSGPYPWSLKQRVAGRHGHLSNREAAEAIEELAGERLELVVLYHLSQTNNLPALAAASVGEALEGAGSRARMIVAEQAEPSEWMEARGA
jgi:phosphoribosyl 1,2-cyclic phosphodiesterase